MAARTLSPQMAGGFPTRVRARNRGSNDHGFLRDTLNAFLRPLLREKPEETVQVECAETAGDPPQRVVKLSLQPSLKMQGKDIDFTLQIAL